jgi:hypothetical protein
VLKHYANGANLADDWERSERRPLDEPAPELRAIRTPCVTRERCPAGPPSPENRSLGLSRWVLRQSM